MVMDNACCVCTNGTSLTTSGVRLKLQNGSSKSEKNQTTLRDTNVPLTTSSLIWLLNKCFQLEIISE